MKKITFVVGCIVATIHSFSSVAKEPTQSLSPVLLDTKDGDATTIGLQFKYEGGHKFATSNESQAPASESTAAPDGTPPVEVFTDPEKLRYVGLALKYEISGTATAEAENNPENLVDAFIDLQFKSSNPDAFGTITGGALVKYETDQAFENEQWVYGLSATYGKDDIFGKKGFFGIDLGRGLVDPTEDKARQTALGTTSLDKYYRNELEILFIYPIGEAVPFLGKMADSFEFNYRYYQESGAPAAVEAAKLDTFFLRTFRLNLEHDLFIAYSEGKLPFDVQEDEFFTLGFKYDLN